MKCSFIKIWALCLIPLLFFTACAPNKNAVGAPNTADDIGQLLEQKSFEFVPQSVLPTGGRSRQVTGEFFLRINGQTLQSYLPYFGRAFSGAMDPSRGGMDFTTTNFGYQVGQGKRDATVITIEPRSGTDVRQMILDIYPNGNASLRALSNNRSAISYNGFIRAIRK